MSGNAVGVEVSEMSLRDILFILFRNRKMIVGFFSAAVFLAVAVTVLTPRTYRSEARLLVRLGRESVTLDPTASSVGQVVAITRSRESEVNSEMEIIKSRDLAEMVVRAVGPERILGRSAAAMPVQQGGGPVEAGTIGHQADASKPPESPRADVEGAEKSEGERDRAVDRVMKGLDVEALKETNIIDVTLEAQSPGLAQEVLTQLIRLYLDKHMAAHRTEGSYAFFEEQKQQLAELLSQTEEKLRDFKNGAEIGSLDEQRRILMTRIGDLTREKEDAESAFAASSGKTRSLQSSLANLPPELVIQETSGLSNTATDGMRQRLYDLQLKEQDLLSKFTENSEPVKEIRRQIGEAQNLLKQEATNRTQVTKGPYATFEKVKSDLVAELAISASLAGRIKSTREQLNAAQQELKTFNETEVNIAQLQRDLENQKSSYASYSHGLEQARMDQALEKGKISNISTIQPPTFSPEKIRPRPGLNLALGFLVGILGAVGLAFGREFLDHTIKRPQDVAERLDLPTLISIPAVGGSRSALGAIAAPQNGTAALPAGNEIARREGEAASAPSAPRKISADCEPLLAQLVLSSNGTSKPSRVIAVTSCRKGEGVSTVAATLAVALARRRDGHVLLVDASGIRRPLSMERLVVPADAIRAGGDLSSSERRVFESTTPAALLDLLRNGHNFVVLDAPALLEQASSVSLSSLADGVILVVEAERTRWESAQSAKQLLQRSNANLLGVVINKREFHIPEWLYRRL